MCPWAKENFGIEGPGEGLVFHARITDYEYTFFKAKGESHKLKNNDKPAVSNPEYIKQAFSWAENVVTEARLEQGYTELVNNKGRELSIKDTGDFVRWVCNDVIKECSDDMFQSGLTWDKVGKYVGKLGSRWYVKKF